LLIVPDAAARTALVASAITQFIRDSACAVHRVVATDHGPHWSVLAVAGDASYVQESIPDDSFLVGHLLSEEPRAAIDSGAVVRREDYAHLHISRSVESIAYVPLLLEEQLIGAIEIFTFAVVLGMEQIEELEPLIAFAAPAIVAAETASGQRQELLDSVHRMTQLYDLEKSLNSTLELDQVIAQIPAKAISMLPCQAVHLWLFDGGTLRLVSSCGEDSTVELQMTQAPEEGYVADMAEEGEPVLIADPHDERLPSATRPSTRRAPCRP
jgi:GAF domain-containing protein